jgi:ACS family hexuronate transporter-like MFS transporter
LGWSFAAIAHALAKSTFHFGIARAALGITESGNFPSANKAIAEWFPKKERAFATGIYNSGANIGAIVAPLCVPWMAYHWGWQSAFIITGIIGLVWLSFWWAIFKSPQEKLAAGKLSQAEYNHIHSDVEQAPAAPQDKTERKTSWLQLLRYRQTWSFFFGKFLTDPVWWFFLFWLPAFLNGENARKLAAGDAEGVIAWPLAIAVVYTISTVGSVLGGWLPKYLVNKKAMTIFKARKLSMFIYALLPLAVLLAQYVGTYNTWYAVLLIGVACAGHQAWSANIYTTVSDMFPQRAIASVTGIGGMAGAFGGILIAWLAGLLLDYFKALGTIETGYGIMFIICALAYLLAWIVMHFLVPKFKPIKD